MHVLDDYDYEVAQPVDSDWETPEGYSLKRAWLLTGFTNESGRCDDYVLVAVWGTPLGDYKTHTQVATQASLTLKEFWEGAFSHVHAGVTIKSGKTH